jgi:hypothetical protein
MQIHGLELVGYEEQTDSLASLVYSNVSPEPVPYHWQLDGSELTITMDEGATMHATISDDVSLLRGSLAAGPRA